MPDRIIPTIDGKRGGLLVILGIWYGLVGLSYVVTVTPSRERAFQWLPIFLDSTELGWLWIIISALIGTYGLVSNRHDQWERAAYGLAIVPPALWAAIFAVSWAVYGNPHGWVSAVTYSAWVAVILHCAGWPNPVDVPLRGPGEAR